MAEVEGFGTKLEYGNQATASASTIWTEVAEIVDIEPPTDDVADIETTHHQSTGKRKTYQGGLIESGEAKLTCHFDKTAFGTLRGFLGTAKGYRITFSDTSMIAFDGYLKGIGPKTPLDGIVTVDCTFKLSGVPTYTAAT